MATSKKTKTPDSTFQSFSAPLGESVTLKSYIVKCQNKETGEISDKTLNVNINTSDEEAIQLASLIYGKVNDIISITLPV